MSRVEKTVFISYRRTNMPWALAIYQNLTAHGYDVFFDYRSIGSGDFEQIILGNIRARAHFVVVLTPSALERCDDPGDWLRREIETAMDEKRNIVPIFLEGFDFNSPSISKHLTGKLANLKRYNGLNIPAGYFDEAMSRVHRDFLNVSLDTVFHPVSSTVQRAVIRQQSAASKAASVKEKELSAQEWFERGNKFLNDKQYDESIHCYTEAILLAPDEAVAYYDRGLARTYSRDLNGAIKDYTDAIRLKPDYAEAYNNRGRVRYDKGDLDDAIQDYTRSIGLGNPELYMTYDNRGLARQKKGDIRGAIQDYTEAMRLKPDYSDAYLRRGNARHDKGDIRGAIKDYTEAVRLKPDSGGAYYNRGNARYDMGDLDGAIKDYTEVIRIKKDFADVYRERGNVWGSKGDYYSAASDYQKYLDLGGTDEIVRQLLKDARKRTGRTRP